MIVDHVMHALDIRYSDRKSPPVRTSRCVEPDETGQPWLFGNLIHICICRAKGSAHEVSHTRALLDGMLAPAFLATAAYMYILQVV